MNKKLIIGYGIVTLAFIGLYFHHYLAGFAKEHFAEHYQEGYKEALKKMKEVGTVYQWNEK